MTSSEKYILIFLEQDFYCFIYIYVHIYRVAQKGIHSLLINIFGINLNEISISG